MNQSILGFACVVALAACHAGARATPSVAANPSESPADVPDARAGGVDLRAAAPGASPRVAFESSMGGGSGESEVPVLPNSNPEMSDKDRKAFYHLSEGSEVFPVTWMLALRTKTGRFVDQLSQYGLLRDATDRAYNPYGLPIGMTAAVTLDLRLFNLRMVGFNCAACHVGQIQAAGKTFNILGAPNLFDINGFFVGLSEAVQFTLKDDCTDVLRLLRDLLHENEGRRLKDMPEQGDDLMLMEPSTRATAVDRQAYRDVRALLINLSPGTQKTPGPGILHDLLDQMNNLCATEGTKDLGMADHLPLVKARPGRSLERGTRTCFEQDDDDSRLTAASMDPGATPSVARLRSDAARQHFISTALLNSLATSPDPAADLKDALPDLSTTGTSQQIRDRLRVSLGDFLENWAVTIRLLRTRLKSIEALAHGVKGRQTPAGPGRVDAFMTSHNLLFPQEPPADMTSPVSYPSLWNLPTRGWLHWDANTNSILQRNVGQAIGLGAVVDAQGDSTVCIRNIHELEVLARTFTPPKWPEDLLPKLDEGKVKSGKALFQTRCANCHTEDGGQTTAASEVGTDANRASSGAMLMADKRTQFVDALRDKIMGIAAKAYAREFVTKQEQHDWDPHPSWQVTRAYVRRPLAGIWATAPYLHNGSVPTLADLLENPKRRPDAFVIGDRSFDTDRVGYRTGTFAFNTTEDGNENGGHPYGTADLKESEKRDLIEYLKSLSIDEASATSTSSREPR